MHVVGRKRSSRTKTLCTAYELCNYPTEILHEVLAFLFLSNLFQAERDDICRMGYLISGVQGDIKERVHRSIHKALLDISRTFGDLSPLVTKGTSITSTILFLSGFSVWAASSDIVRD